MSKYEHLSKNVVLNIISNFGTKFIGFFLIPLYTSVLSTTEYGIYDIINTTIGVLLPILTVEIAESVMRFIMDENQEQSKVFMIGCRYLMISSVILVFFLIINHVGNYIKIIDDFAVYFFIMYFVRVSLEIALSFARGLDRIADVSISGILCTIVMITLNLVFLIHFKMGLDGYFLANIIGMLVQAIYLLGRVKCWRYFNIHIYDKQLQKEMLKYSKPIVPTSIAWWINSALDKYIIVWFWGVNENGIYSVASKIPSILDGIQMAMNQAWVISAVKELDSDKREDFFSDIYSMYSCIMSIVCAMLIMLNRLLARFLYANDFFVAWRFAPFLMIAIVFGAMSGYANGIFLAVRETKICARSTIMGAIINILLNLVLIPFYGALGAAIATAISYWIVWIIRVYYLKRYVAVKLHLLREHIVYFVFIMQMVCFNLFLEEVILLYVIQIICFIVVLILFNKEISKIYTLLLVKLKEFKHIG